ncbi:MAG: hypothetical protein IBJ00_01435 [Alphaproteobacteria bacterium]|nr:hypothetical protein [Alphaproteobacteria bacterium]
MNILEGKYARGKLSQGLFALLSILDLQELDQLKSYHAELDLKFALVLKEHILAQPHIAQRYLKTTNH